MQRQIRTEQLTEFRRNLAAVLKGRSAPKYLNIELNSGCSLGCPFCSDNVRLPVRDPMPFDLLEAIAEVRATLKCDHPPPVNLYFSTDPLDYEYMGKTALDAAKLFEGRTYDACMSTTVPRGKEELFLAVFDSDLSAVELSFSFMNEQRLLAHPLARELVRRFNPRKIEVTAVVHTLASGDLNESTSAFGRVAELRKDAPEIFLVPLLFSDKGGIYLGKVDAPDSGLLRVNNQFLLSTLIKTGKVKDGEMVRLSYWTFKGKHDTHNEIKTTGSDGMKNSRVVKLRSWQIFPFGRFGTLSSHFGILTAEHQCADSVLVDASGAILWVTYNEKTQNIGKHLLHGPIVWRETAGASNWMRGTY